MGRGQVTLYVILGLLLVFLIGTYLYIRTESVQNELDSSLQQALAEEPKKYIAQHVSSSLKATLSKTKGLLDPIAPLFGNLIPPPLIPSFDSPQPQASASEPCDTQIGDLAETPPSEVSFDRFPHTYTGDHYTYYFNLGGVENIPSLEDFGRMFAQKIREDIPVLMEKIPKDRADFQIVPERVRVQVLLTAEGIQTKMSIPLCIEGEPTSPVQIGPVKVKSGFAQMLDFSRWIIQQDIEHPDYIDVSLLEEEAERREMKVNVIEEDHARIYTLIDMNPDTDQALLTLSFASIL